MTTECSAHGNLPNALAAGLDESWQRVGTTGNASADFVRATATPGEADAATPASVPDGGVRIDEIAAAGPTGSADDVVELRNAGPDDVDVSGWRLYRCTARGELSADTLQLTLPQGTVLAPDDRYLVGGPGYSPSGDEREADASTRTSLADTVSGVLLTTAEGVRVDGVTVSNHLDTACQTGDEKLGSTLDFRTGESWQRHPVSGGFSISSRTPGARNRSIDAAPASAADVQAWTQVAISEFAVDPAIEPAPAGFVRHHFIELGNYGSTPADIGGWRIIGCRVDGFRDTDTLVTVPDGITIEPGGTWVTALRGDRGGGPGGRGALEAARLPRRGRLDRGCRRVTRSTAWARTTPTRWTSAWSGRVRAPTACRCRRSRRIGSSARPISVRDSRASTSTTSSRPSRLRGASTSAPGASRPS